ncbi:MAG: aminotransferase class III-fold pyridoxal phosphate-dependent enzyme, partial [Gammaproteobacteria bacterium]|nr:aminotransferase class III-fold pyridoxal phosphate-dependent enzyme [Gammaproteobacteria bacterium]
MGQASDLQTSPAELDLVRAELESHWVPFTDNKSFKDDPRLLVKGDGMHLWDQHGDRLLDGSSGLFTTAAGHCRPEITEAVADQLAQLDYIPSFLRSHPRSFELANKLVPLLPTNMNHVFFCNSGSESVDSAMKIALQYHASRGEGGRNVFVSRDRAYHGVNIGGTSLSGMMKNRQGFNAMVPGVVHMRSTFDPEQRYSMGQPLLRGEELADDLLRIVQTHGANSIAACFIEPIAGSTGVLVPPVGYLERIRELCDEYEILMVMDEVLT